MSDPPSPKPPSVAARAPLTVVRRIVAAIGIIIMLLTGGCTLFFVGSLLIEGGGGGSEIGLYIGIALFYGAIPFLVGLAIFLLATRVGR